MNFIFADTLPILLASSLFSLFSFIFQKHRVTLRAETLPKTEWYISIKGSITKVPFQEYTLEVSKNTIITICPQIVNNVIYVPDPPRIFINQDKIIKVSYAPSFNTAILSQFPECAPLFKDVKIQKIDLSNWNPQVWVNYELYGYKVVSVIGSGGNGYVLKVTLSGKEYAMKVLAVSREESKDVTRIAKHDFEQIFKESENLKKVSQLPYFVKIYGVYIDTNLIASAISGNLETYFKYPPAIIMDFMEGGSVEGLLKNEKIRYSRYWPLIVKEIIKQTALALAYLHYYGYAHLDVKPQNIFLNKKLGNTGEDVYKNILNSVKLGDLGSAVKIGEKVTQITPAYAPPDQLEAIITGKGASSRMDVFALGMTAYSILTAKLDNPATEYLTKSIEVYTTGNKEKALEYIERAKESLSRWIPVLPGETPKDLAEVIIKALSVNPKERPYATYIYQMLK